MDNTNEKIKAMINSIGALAELSGIFLKELLRNGFTREESVTIISSMISSSLFSGPTNSNNGEK